MRAPNLNYCKNQGFTLLEALVGLVLFSIIFMGSGAALKHLLGTQTQINTSLIVTNELQSRLQKAMTYTGAAGTGICSAVDQTNFTLENKTYYTVCATETISVGVTSTGVDWPILVASISQSDAQDCANGTVQESCYIVGR